MGLNKNIVSAIIKLTDTPREEIQLDSSLREDLGFGEEEFEKLCDSLCYDLGISPEWEDFDDYSTVGDIHKFYE